jgi:fibro-slime domain-containing protein
VWFSLLFGCSEYALGKGAPTAGPADSGDPPGEGTAVVVDTPPTDSGEPPFDPDDCEDGYYADYYNLPASHPEVEIDEGDRTGDLPANHDWWDPVYFVFRQVDPGLEFGDGWWPVNTGLEGDPQYFAVHWVGTLDVDSDLVVAFEMGSDDDSWAYLDGDLAGALPGIHGIETTTFLTSLSAGQHTFELFMAERHTSGSGFWFRWDSPEVGFYACPE